MQKLFGMKEKMKKDNKGFTLVEIIVVLVILAILMAALVPSMIGFVKEAQGKAYVTEARSAYVALQSKVTEECALDPSFSSTSKYAGDIASGSLASIMEGSYTSGASVTYSLSSSKVASMVYSVNGKTITIEPGKAAVIK